MKKYIITGMTAAVILTGCAGPMNNTERGAVTGTVLGAGLGAIIGNQSVEAGKGALLGGAAGALLGGGIGNAKDKKSGNK